MAEQDPPTPREPLQASSTVLGPSAEGTPLQPDARFASQHEATPERPRFIFFGVVASVVLVLDVLSKAWAELELSRRSLSDGAIVVWEEHLSFTLAYNRGGAWGLLQDASELIRKPFFFGVSIAAVVFIVSLYSRIDPKQVALRWGLPLVLGGALGNLADRVIRGSVVDFIDYRAGWVEAMNRGIAKVVASWNVTDHWPTFNVADISICIGVGLMAVDMITSRKHVQGNTSGPGAAPHDNSGPHVADVQTLVDNPAPPAVSER